VSRSKNVTLSTIIAEANNDIGLVIDTDAQGLAPDGVLDGVTVSGYVASGNLLGDLRIGTSSNPGVDGVPKNVTVNMRSRSLAGETDSSIVIAQGQRIKVTAEIDGSAGDASLRSIALTAAGGATYSTEIELYATINSSGYGVQVESALQTSTNKINIELKNSTCVSGEFEFVGGEEATTNDNLRYRRSNGYAARTYSSSGSNLTLPVGGITDLIMSASGATTVLNMTPATEGAEITIHFTNGNTTFLNTNFFTPAAANFVGTASDVIAFKYRGGAWRCTNSSIN
jgi:hypothetical protein